MSEGDTGPIDDGRWRDDYGMPWCAGCELAPAEDGSPYCLICQMIEEPAESLGGE